MAIETTAQLETALNSRFSRFYLNKTAIDPTNGGAGFNISHWLATGTPAAGAVGTTTATAFNHLSTGAIPFMQQTSPRKSYLADLKFGCTGVAGHTVEIHDRLIHMGGLNTNITTQQNITGFDLSLFLATNNIDARKGDANYSEVQWWFENFSNGGTNVVNITVNVTYNDGTAGTLSIPGAISFARIGRVQALNNWIPAVDSGKFIRGITSVTLAAQVGAFLNFGFTATRYRGSILMEATNQIFDAGWTELGFPEIHNQSCLFPIVIAPGTNVGNIRLDGVIAHG
jgi:hypothetical protein